MKKTAVIISIIGLVLVGSFGARLAFSQIYTAPTVQTYGATNIFNNAATFNGDVNSNGYQTTYYFEYGTGSSLGMTTSYQTVDPYNYNRFASYQLSNLS